MLIQRTRSDFWRFYACAFLVKIDQEMQPRKCTQTDAQMLYDVAMGQIIHFKFCITI